jgi:hypothetical protein
VKVVVKHHVHFDAALGGPVPGPVVQLLAKVYGGGVDREELAFEFENFSFPARHVVAILLGGAQGRVKGLLEEPPIPHRVGVGDGGAVRIARDSRKPQLPLKRFHGVLYLPQGGAAGHPAQNHGFQMGAGAELLDPFVRLGLRGQRPKVDHYQQFDGLGEDGNGGSHLLFRLRREGRLDCFWGD